MRGAERRFFASEGGVLDAEMFGDPGRQIREATEHVLISGNQFVATVCDVGERTEAVDLRAD